MKIQDIFFVVILAFVAWNKNRTLLVFAGLGSLILSMPLFAGWIFFTAQRLTWYAGAFFSVYILREIMIKPKGIL